jgi:hypothetical protein
MAADTIAGLHSALLNGKVFNRTAWALDRDSIVSMFPAPGRHLAK